MNKVKSVLPIWKDSTFLVDLSELDYRSIAYKIPWFSIGVSKPLPGGGGRYGPQQASMQSVASPLQPANKLNCNRPEDTLEDILRVGKTVYTSSLCV